MKLILKNIQIIDPEGEHHEVKTDLYIKDGFIERVGKVAGENADEILDGEGLVVMPGCLDVNTFIGVPGFEEKENLETLNKAAIQGGFTTLIPRTDLHPSTDHAGQISNLKKISSKSAIEILPLGSISKNLEGKELAELYDMHQEGAIAFCDAKKANLGVKLISLAMQYVKSFDGKLLFFADEPELSKGGQMNEGVTSIHLGMKGIPAIAEEMAVKKIIDLALYNESSVIFFGISTASALREIKAAKKSGVHVKAGVFAHHLFFDETTTVDFDSNFKLKPPLRTQKDIAAIIEGIIDGTIDFISADHCPENIENKEVEFEYASTGMTGLETALSASWSVLKNHIDISKFATLWSVNNRKMFNLDVQHIKEGSLAELTIFDPNVKYVFEKKHQKSFSKNTAYFGKELTGKTIGIITKSKLHKAI